MKVKAITALIMVSPLIAGLSAYGSLQLFPGGHVIESSLLSAVFCATVGALATSLLRLRKQLEIQSYLIERMEEFNQPKYDQLAAGIKNGARRMKAAMPSTIEAGAKLRQR